MGTLMSKSSIPRRFRCNHGCVVPPSDHAVSRFMNTIDEGWNKDRDVLAVVCDAVEVNPEVWNNADYRQMAIDILLSIGTNMILDGSNHRMAQYFGICISTLECYDGEGDSEKAQNLAQVKVLRSLPFGSGVRDALKFYTKRVACSCLKDSYKHARKTLPKIGMCDNCQQVKERASLMTCGRCKVPLYCSRECQVANVPAHKEECSKFADIRRQLYEMK